MTDQNIISMSHELSELDRTDPIQTAGTHLTAFSYNTLI